MGVRAVNLSSANDNADNKDTYMELVRYDSCYNSEQERQTYPNRMKMLYITPERFAKSTSLRDVLKKVDEKGMLSRFVIDEAHCLSQWGHEFRPDYLSLRDLRRNHPDVPIMALTATANKVINTTLPHTSCLMPHVLSSLNSLTHFPSSPLLPFFPCD